MKNLVFTAIAMIAFSGASIANTKEVKKEVTKEETPKKDCVDAAIAYYEAVMGCCRDNITFYNSLVSRCK